MTDVIKGSGNQGDFVLKGQDLATKQGFGNVSKLWYDQTISFDEAHEQLAEDVETRDDILCLAKDMVPTYLKDENRIVFEYQDGRQFEATEHAMRQYGTRTDIPHTYINWKMGATDVGDVSTFFQELKNRHRYMNPNKKFLWRTYDDTTLRACLTEQYAVIDNGWYLSQLQRIMPDGRVSHFNFTDADTLRANILIPDSIRSEDDSDYGGMVSVHNDEIGGGAFEQYPSVFRAICMNGCIWDQTTGKQHRRVHRGEINLRDLAMRLEQNITRQIPLLNTGIDMMLDMRKLDFGTVKARNILVQTMIDSQMTGQQSSEFFKNFLQYSDGERTAFNIVDALTRTGQDFGPATWRAFDLAAGRIMEGGEPAWETIKAKASSLTDKDFEKLNKRVVASQSA